MTESCRSIDRKTTDRVTEKGQKWGKKAIYYHNYIIISYIDNSNFLYDGKLPMSQFLFIFKLHLFRFYIPFSVIPKFLPVLPRYLPHSRSFRSLQDLERFKKELSFRRVDQRPLPAIVFPGTVSLGNTTDLMPKPGVYEPSDKESDHLTPSLGKPL
jgi:hypothetical protein